MIRNAILIIITSVLIIFLPLPTGEQPSNSLQAWDSPFRVPAGRFDSIRTDLSDYIWPTDAGRIVTSTFAEFRRTHFHGGIDISTGNTTGYRVFAARDGYVSRIRVSPVGYGKMLFIRHPDGYISTYAHLEGFNQRIEERVAAEQQRLGRYPVSIECAPEDFPVAKGEVIAFTGETGTGSPHLHFEIRDPHMDFINPFLCENISPMDDFAPRIRSIALRPVEAESYVDGKWTPKIIKIPSGAGHQYRIDEPVYVTGKVGFSVHVRDRMNGSRFQNGLYSHKLFVGDTLVWFIKFDRAPSRDAHQIGLYYDWELLTSGLGRHEKLYIDSPHRLPFYEPSTSTSGVIQTSSFAEGAHDFRIVSSDFNGNTFEVSGTLIINHLPSFDAEIDDDDNIVLDFVDIEAARSIALFTKQNWQNSWVRYQPIGLTGKSTKVIVPLPRNRFDIVKIVAKTQWGTESHPRFIFVAKPVGQGEPMHIDIEVAEDFVRVFLRTDGVFTAIPDLTVYEGSTHRSIPLEGLDLNLYVGTFRPLHSYKGARRLVGRAEINSHGVESTKHLEIYPLEPNSSGEISLDNRNLLLSFEPASVFKTTFLRVQKDYDTDGQPLYSLLPEHTVLDRGITVRIKSMNSKSREGLFFTTGGSWNLLATAFDSSSGYYLGELTRTLGKLAVKTDDEPPRISRLSIANISSKRPSISFRYRDNLSGVDYDELKMYIDDVLVIPEIDGEHHRVFYRVTNPLERGSHRLRIHLQDRLGNTATEERHFVVR